MYWITPIITATAGWLAVILTIKAIFWPKTPINLGFVKIQGLIPKYRKKLPDIASQIFDSDTISNNALMEKIRYVDTSDDTDRIIEEKLDIFIVSIKKEMPMVSMFLSDSVTYTIKDLAKRELTSAIPEIMEKIAPKILEGFNINTVIEEKLQDYTADKIENIIRTSAKKELRIAKLCGGALGFMLGLIQVAIAAYMSL